MAALMTSVMDNTSKITGYIETCKKMGIEVMPPNINKGYPYFDAQEGHILFGLAAIKNVGKNVVERIVEEREKRGSFKSLTDFYHRMDSKDTNKRSIESLILAGAFDSLGGKRSQYLAVYKQIADGISYTRKNNIAGQIDLFGLSKAEEAVDDKDHLPSIDEFESKELLSYEKEVLGIYVSGHPLEKVRGQLEKYITMTSDAFILDEESEDNGLEKSSSPVQDGKRVIVGGLLAAQKVIFTKSNQKMAFITLEDLRGSLEVVIFPNLYEQFLKFEEDSVFLVKGRISIKEETNVVILAEQITTLEKLLDPMKDEKCIILKLTSDKRTPEIRQSLLSIFQEFKGNTKVVVENAEDGTLKPFPPKYNVQISEQLIQRIGDLIGTEYVIIKK